MCKYYDHEAERAKQTQEQIDETLQTAYKQYGQAARNQPIDCAGIGCERKRLLLYIYRCWFCGKYFCPLCAKIHFGDRR